MKKLEIELFRYGTLVFGKVLHQDESLRNKNSEKCVGILAKNDDFRIVSYDSPELRVNTLFIKGQDTTGDNNVFSQNFHNKEIAIQKCEQIKACLDIINKDETDTDTDKTQCIERVI